MTTGDMTDTHAERMAAFVATLNLPPDLVPALLQFRCGCAAQRDPADGRWYGSPCSAHVLQTITRQVVAPNGGGVIIHGK